MKQPQRKRISPDDKVPLKLTDRERTLILDETLTLEEETEKRLRLVAVDGKHLVLRLTLDDFEDLDQVPDVVPVDRTDVL